MSYVYKPYPKWLYHKELGEVVVHNEADHKAHEAEGWVDSPAKFANVVVDADLKAGESIIIAEPEAKKSKKKTAK